MQAEIAKRILSVMSCQPALKHGLPCVPIHNAHITSVVPVTVSLAVLPSSHSRHFWKIEPFVVFAKSESRQTIPLDSVPEDVVEQTSVHGDWGFT